MLDANLSSLNKLNAPLLLNDKQDCLTRELCMVIMMQSMQCSDPEELSINSTIVQGAWLY